MNRRRPKLWNFLEWNLAKRAGHASFEMDPQGMNESGQKENGEHFVILKRKIVIPMVSCGYSPSLLQQRFLVIFLGCARRDIWDNFGWAHLRTFLVRHLWHNFVGCKISSCSRIMWRFGKYVNHKGFLKMKDEQSLIDCYGTGLHPMYLKDFSNMIWSCCYTSTFWQNQRYFTTNIDQHSVQVLIKRWTHYHLMVVYWRQEDIPKDDIQYPPVN